MNHSKHSYLMIGLLVLGAALYFTGFAGGAVLFLLWPLACVAMMFFMMRGMGGMGGMHGNDEVKHEDSDAVRASADVEPRS